MTITMNIIIKIRMPDHRALMSYSNNSNDKNHVNRNDGEDDDGDIVFMAVFWVDHRYHNHHHHHYVMTIAMNMIMKI